MGNYFSVIVLGVAAALQASIAPQIRILGGEPDLVFLAALSWSVNARLEDGVVWAFVGGILHDLLSAAPIGTSAISMILLVFALDIIRRQVYQVTLPLLILIVMLGSLAHQIILMLVLALVGFELRLDNVFYVVIPTIAYNLILIWPIYWLIRRLQRRLARGRRVSIQA